MINTLTPLTILMVSSLNVAHAADVSNETWQVTNRVLAVTVSARDAGVVCSLVYRGKELVNDFDHGRQLQVAWSYNDADEAYNNKMLQAGVIPAFANDAATDQWLRKQSPSYLRMAEYVDRKWGTEFGIATNSPGGLAYLKDGKGHIDLNETLKGAHRVSVIVFEMTNLYQQERHEEITTPVRRGELQDATKFAMLREAVEYDGLRLHREVLFELERAVGELPPEMITWVSSTATNLTGYALPYAYDYFKAQAKGGHTEHYYRLFKKHTAEAKQDCEALVPSKQSKEVKRETTPSGSRE